MARQLQCVRVIKGKKTKGKKSQGKEGKRDLSKIICFHCHEHGHHVLNCLQKKESKKEPTVAVGEALDSKFKLDFILIACMDNTGVGCMWYIDNGASFHMTGNRDLFIDLVEKDLH